ncbi:MAG TPA: PAS domain S-box protein, partial [Longimicrobiales bacterium]
MPEISAGALFDAARLSALRRTGLLDSPPDEAFDRITRLAAALMRTPIALISLVELDRQFFKSQVGLAEPWASRREAPLSHSLCEYVVASARPLAVDDVDGHPLTSNHRALADFGVVAYAGIPLLAAPGVAIGTLCVIDGRPREWTAAELQLLQDLAATVMTEIDARRGRGGPHEHPAHVESFHRALIEHATDAFAVLDADGTIRYCSAAIEAITGRRPEERLGRKLLEFVHADDAPRLEAMLRRIAGAGGAPASIDVRVLHRSGDWRVLEAQAQNLLDRPEVAGIVVALRDVTERRARDAALRRMATVLDATSDFVSTADPHGRLLYMNRAGRRMVGIGEDDDVRGCIISDFHPPPAAERLLREAIPAAVRDGVWTGETTLLGADGREIPVSEVIVVQTTQDGKVAFLSTIMRDLTERKAMEDALAQSARDYKGLFESAHDAILVLDPESRQVLDVNRRACELYGLTRDEFIGTPLGALLGDNGRADHDAYERLASGVDHQFETVHHRRDGTEMFLEINAAAVDYKGRRAILSINRDVTQRKALEEKLQQAQRLEAVGRLAGGIAHDFNNLLTAIRGRAQLLLDELPDGTPVRTDVVEIREAAERAAGLTRQLLAFSRRQVLQPKVVDLREVVEGMEKMLRRLLGEDVT